MRDKMEGVWPAQSVPLVVDFDGVWRTSRAEEPLPSRCTRLFASCACTERRFRDLISPPRIARSGDLRAGHHEPPTHGLP